VTIHIDELTEAPRVTLNPCDHLPSRENTDIPPRVVLNIASIYGFEEDGSQRFLVMELVEGAYSNVPGLSYDVGPDGRLLLLRTDGGTERPSHLNVILNWKVDVEE